MQCWTGGVRTPQYRMVRASSLGEAGEDVQRQTRDNTPLSSVPSPPRLSNMRAQVLRILLFFLYSLAAVAAEAERNIDIFAWPLSSPKPQTLAKVSFTSTNASIKSFKAPSIPPEDDIVRIGFHHASGKWSGIATAASNLAPGKPQRLQLHVKSDGDLYHVGYKVAEGVSQGKGESTKGDLSVEVVKIQLGPTPHLDKPVVVSPDGTTEQKEPEKTFLQKYWWAIALFLVLQVAVGGSKE